MLIQNRRGFLQFGTLGLLGASMSKRLRAETAGTDSSVKAHNMILVWLGGGPSTIDMWDPKPDAPDSIRGEFSTISTAVPEIQLSEHLPKMAGVMSDCTLVRSVHHSIPAHVPGSQYLLTGHLPSAATEFPSLGSVATSLIAADAPLPPYIAFGNPTAGGAGYLGSAWNPFELQENATELPRGVSLGDQVDSDEFTERVQLRNVLDRRFDSLGSDSVVGGLDTFHQQAVSVLKNDSIRGALDVRQESAEVLELFGERSTLGMNAIRAVRLIEKGARFITVGTTGWDTHSNNFGDLRNQLLPRLDQALSALIVTLESRGLLASTIVCCCGEFGRTPSINSNGGRDHWSRAMSVLLAGGGFQRGYVHGKTDSHGGEPIDGDCTPSDLAATILSQFGIDPDARITTATGREVPIMRNGMVINELLA